MASGNVTPTRTPPADRLDGSKSVCLRDSYTDLLEIGCPLDSLLEIE